LTNQLIEKLQKELPDYFVTDAMRYTSPFSQTAIARIKERKINDIVLLPLYPQYSTTTVNAYVTARMSYVSTPISGIIDKIYVSDHQVVHEGQLLLTLDPRQYEYALNIAKSKLAELEISLKIKAVDIVNLKKAIEVAQSDFNFQKDRYSGAQKLNHKEVIATLKYDQIKNDYLKAEYLMEQAQQNLQNAQLEQTNIHNKIDEASNNIKLVEYNLESTRIYASTSGIVTNLTMIKGSPVAAYKSIVTLIDTSSWWVQAN